MYRQGILEKDYVPGTIRIVRKKIIEDAGEESGGTADTPQLSGGGGHGSVTRDTSLAAPSRQNEVFTTTSYETSIQGRTADATEGGVCHKRGSDTGYDGSYIWHQELFEMERIDRV